MHIVEYASCKKKTFPLFFEALYSFSVLLKQSDFQSLKQVVEFLQIKFQILRNGQLLEAICTWLGLHASHIHLILSTGDQVFQDATQYQRMLPIRRLSTQTHLLYSEQLRE